MHDWLVRKGFIATTLIWLWDCDVSFGIADEWSLELFDDEKKAHQIMSADGCCFGKQEMNKTITKPAFVVIAANVKKLFHTLVWLLFDDSFYFTLF